MDNGAKNVAVAVGRQFGSGGREAGKCLAGLLGCDYYDKELLERAASEAGIGREFFESVDERAPSPLDSLPPLSLGVSAHAFYAGGSTISADGLYRSQADVIRELPRRGSCVIVGRSADYVLREHPRLASVFISAPIEARVRRIMGREPGLTAAAARALAERNDRLRAAYYNFYTDRVWGAAETYDLCVNTAGLAPEEVAGLIVDYLRRRFPGVI